VVLQFIEIIKWPVVGLLGFVVALLIFRSPITKLLGRARRAGFGDKTILDFSPTPAEQQKALEPPSAIAASMVRADAIRPPPLEIYAEIERETSTVLEASKYPPDLQIAWLTRAVAVHRVLRDHEIVYRLILGSQIELLFAANTAPLPNMVRAHQIFDAAKARFSDLYINFSFDAWLQFLLNTKLVQTPTLGVEQVVRTTPLGQDFLRYLVNNNLTSPKAG
jgi:hypothetical protein